MSFVSVRVSGNESVSRALAKLGLKVADLRPAWDRIGAEIRKDAISLTPVLTGTLVRSVRQGKTKGSATVRAGSKRLVYAPIQHYGGYHNIEGKFFMTTALHSNEAYAVDQVDTEIDRLIQRLGLN